MLALALAALAFAAPTRDDLAARAKELELPHAHRIAAEALPGARLEPGGEAAVGGNRLGGDPDLPASMRWPRCGGRKLSFLGQLRLADLPAGSVPATGVVAVFAGLQEDDEGVPPVEMAYGRVGKQTCVIVRRLNGPLTRRAVPRAVPRLRSRPVRLRPTLTVPDAYIAEKRYGLTDAQYGTWSKLMDEAIAGRLRHRTEYTANHQVLGWPWPIQDTPLYGCGGRAKRLTHRLFLQLDYDEALGFAIGDGGVLYLTGTPADLRAGRFNRLCAEMQEG